MREIWGRDGTRVRLRLAERERERELQEEMVWKNSREPNKSKLFRRWKMKERTGEGG